MNLKDMLNLIWKFLFLVVFTYGVISVTCCQKACQTDCTKSSEQVSQCCKTQSISKCGSNCIKPCCSKGEVVPNSIKKCGTGCQKPCCASRGRGE